MDYVIRFTILMIVCVKGTSSLSGCNVHLMKGSCLTELRAGRQVCEWSSKDGSCHKADSDFDFKESDKGIDMGSYDPVLAYNFTLMNALAYADDPKKCQEKMMPNSDFVLYQGISSICSELSLFKKETCYAYTAVSKKMKVILVAFRGTDFQHNKEKQILDQMISVLFYHKKKFMIGGHVQQYFKNAFERLSPCVNQSLLELMNKYPDYNITITGHSLGAALASLSAASLVFKGFVKAERLSVYQFGDPREGDGKYADNYDKLIKRSWRVVHYRDIVSHLPPCSPFKGCSATNGWPYHTKTEVYYPNEIMNITSPYKICAKNEDLSCSDRSITDKWCLRDVVKCIEYHKHYFGIPVGTFCDNTSSLDDKKKENRFREPHKNLQGEINTCKIENF